MLSRLKAFNRKRKKVKLRVAVTVSSEPQGYIVRLNRLHGLNRAVRSHRFRPMSLLGLLRVAHGSLGSKPSSSFAPISLLGLLRDSPRSTRMRVAATLSVTFIFTTPPTSLSKKYLREDSSTEH